MSTSKKKKSRAGRTSAKSAKAQAAPGLILPGPTTITSVTPSQFSVGMNTQGVVITGSNLPRSFVVTSLDGLPVQGTGITPVSGTPTRAVIDIFISPNVTPGQYRLSTAPNPGAPSFPIRITSSQGLQPPSITLLDPNLIYVSPPQTVYTLIVNGANLPPTVSGFSIRDSSGGTASGITINLIVPSPISAVLQLTISPNTPSGYYQVVVSNAAGTASATLQLINFGKLKDKEKEKEKDFKEKEKDKDFKEKEKDKDFKEKDKEKEKDFKEKDKELKEKEKEKERKEKDFEGFAGFATPPDQLAALQGAPAGSPAEEEEMGRSFISEEERPDVGERSLSKKKKGSS